MPVSTASFVFHPTAPLQQVSTNGRPQALAEAYRGSKNKRSLCHAIELGAHLFRKQIT